MSYQALYRVWRPQRFDEVVGQEMITQTFKNAISSGKTAHAYLLTGPRGTGKTSVAKIFAKAINCPNSKDGEPCNACEICQEITQGSLGDVVEIDAASNNGVEEIRDIREKANYAPTRVPYKIYIIDEVHMLSTGAFNALLKTLEEPPENVIFLLATTEPHKIPLTIISRTQRFDFKRIQTGQMVERMIEILDSDQISYDEASLTLIAQAAEGGMRDALSILDQTLSFSTDNIDEEAVRQITGSVTQEMMIQYLSAISTHDSPDALSILKSLLEEGKDVGRFVEDLILFVRDILLYQSSQAIETSIYKIARITDDFKDLAVQLSPEFCYQVIAQMNETQNKLRLSNHGEVYLEVATIQLSLETSSHGQAESSKSQSSTNISDADQEIRQLSAEIREMKQIIHDMKKASAKSVEKNDERPKRQQMRSAAGSQKRSFVANITDVHQILHEATREHLNKVNSMWGDFIDTLDVSQGAIMKNAKPVAASEDGIVVTFDYPILVERAENDPILQDKLDQFMNQVTGHAMKMVSLATETWPGIRQNYLDQRRAKRQGVNEQSIPEDEQTRQAREAQEAKSSKENQSVQKAIDIFGKEHVTIKE